MDEIQRQHVSRNPHRVVHVAEIAKGIKLFNKEGKIDSQRFFTLMKAGLEVVRIDGVDVADGAIAGTLAAMRRGVPVIVQAALSQQGWAGRVGEKYLRISFLAPSRGHFVPDVRLGGNAQQRVRPCPTLERPQSD